MSVHGHILIVDDHANTRLYLKTLLNHEGYATREAGTGKEALDSLRTHPLPAHQSAILLDLKLPDTTGTDLLEPIRTLYPHLPIIIMTAHATVETAVDAIRKGALNYIEKPIDEKKLLALLSEVTATVHVSGRMDQGSPDSLPLLAGKSPAMRVLADRIRKAASHSIPILITGESGTGKELVAHSIHQLSPRREDPFIAVNTGAISRELVSSELFGHEKGSFTSAVSRKDGWLSTAGKGTLFLDEIGTMELSTQIALLRVLENRTFYRVGGTEELEFHARIIGATNIDPLLLVNQGRLREDLYYRMNVFPIAVPPLRERGEDVFILAERFLKEAFDNPAVRIALSPSAREILRHYPWPGNLRELKNRMIEIAVTQGLGPPAYFELSGHALEPLLLPSAAKFSPADDLQSKPPRTLKEGEKEQILRVLEETEGNKSQAARILGISRKALYAKIREYGIPED